ATVGDVGLGEAGKAPGCGPVERADVDQDPSDDRAVARDVLRGGVEDDVGAPLARAAQIRGGEGVVDHEGDAGRVSDVRQGGEVGDGQRRVADGLGEHEARLGADGGGEGGVVADVDERGGDAETGERVGEDRKSGVEGQG